MSTAASRPSAAQAAGAGRSQFAARFARARNRREQVNRAQSMRSCKPGDVSIDPIAQRRRRPSPRPPPIASTIAIAKKKSAHCIAVPAAGLLVRLFMIQHDCGHSAFFHHRLTNDWVGRVIGVLTLTPYDFWRRTHAIHHATSGNLDRRGIGDVDTLTAHEYLALSRWQRLGYRIYRHPIIMFGLGPAYLFIVQHRLPVGLMRAGWQPWLSAMATNVAIAALIATMIWLVGVVPFVLVHLPIMLLAASIGVWLFYVQHQFEDTAWGS
jgi:fatty acid desaturase